MDDEKLTHLAGKFQQMFDPDRLNELGLEVGFCQRLRKLTPARVIAAIVVTLATGPAKYLTRFSRNFNQMFWNARSDYSPFHRKLKAEGFAALMRAFCQHLIEVAAMRVAKPIKPKLKRFEDIIIQDGTSLTLNATDSLIQRFPSPWTNMAPAAVRLNLTMSLYTDQLCRIRLAPDRTHENQFTPDPERLDGQLFLADAAFNGLDYHEAIDAHGGWYLIRFRSDTNPIVGECWVDGTRQPELEGGELQAIVDQLEGHAVDVSAEWERQGQTNTHGRLSLWPIPPEKRAEGKEDITHLFLATNLDRETFVPRELRQLYRLRWQVELLIRDLKSGAHLAAYQTQKPEIAEGLIWASIAAAILLRLLAHMTQQLYRLVEVSTESTTRAVQFLLPNCVRQLLHDSQWRSTFRCMLRHLSETAPRTHPERDRREGRAASGIRPMPP